MLLKPYVLFNVPVPTRIVPELLLPAAPCTSSSNELSDVQPVTVLLKKLAEMSAAQIQQARFKRSADRILTLGELRELVAGRATLLLELKSRFDGDDRLVRRAAEVLAGYKGPVAVMSFDPGMVGMARRIAPGLTRGIVAQRHYDDWPALPKAYARGMAHLLHVHRTRPHFVAYRVQDLPTLATAALRLAGLPLLTWTVRTEEDRRRAARWADQIIFEGWRP